jgi:threonine dehydratase
MSPADQPGLDGVDVTAVIERLRSHVRPTTSIESERFDRAVGHSLHILLVSETFQHTGSFKFRAAMSVALHSHATKLLTASSGNFGAALAAAAARTGKSCTVVMPARSAEVKVAAVRSYGATVDLIDTSRVTRAARVEELRRADPSATVVSPYDDAHVIAGNASLGWEIFGLPAEQHPDAVVVPVGGGGLASGIVVARNALATSRPVWGAEPLLANDAARSFRSGHLESNDVPEPATICDGARTPSLGKRNWEILRPGRGLKGIVEVDDAIVTRAVRMLFETANLKVEPTGALAVAALLTAADKFAGKRVACVISGGNVDADLYSNLVR